MLCPMYLNLGVSNTPQSVDEGRLLFGGHMRVADENRITLQALRIGLHVVFDRLAAMLFLTLNEYAYVDGQRTIDSNERLKRFEDEHDLTFIVRGPTTIEVAIANRRLKRGSRPQFHRIDRLNVIVSIDKQGRLAGSLQPLPIDERMPLRLNHFNT